jgi:DNA polymerase elongation subunit (family B)
MTTTVTEKLYELVDLRRVIDTALEATEGELTDDIAAALDQWTEKFDAKAESIALYLVDLEGDAAKIKAEEERLAARRKAILKRCEWLEQYVQKGMEQTGRTKIEGALKTLSLRKNTKVEEVVPIAPDEMEFFAERFPDFVRTVPASFALEKDAIKRASKSGTLPEQIAARVRVAVSHSLVIR